MERTNKPLRTAFADALAPFSLTGIDRKRDAARCIRRFSRELLASAATQTAGQCPLAAPSEMLQQGCPIRGPLARRILDNGTDGGIQRDTAATFAFAGHDTTANM